MNGFHLDPDGDVYAQARRKIERLVRESTLRTLGAVWVMEKTDGARKKIARLTSLTTARVKTADDRKLPACARNAGGKERLVT